MFWIGTSWKMHKTRPEAAAFVDGLLSAGLPEPPEAQLFVVPPFTAIETVKVNTAGLPLLVGAQNVHWAEAGPFTGEVSAAMLAELGCELVEIGHSERRRGFGETDEDVNGKALAVVENGMRPIICIGESEEERAMGAALPSTLRQGLMALAGLSPEQKRTCLLAYEPVWAIGESGQAASPEVVAEVHQVLRAAFPECTLLYGGSVSLENCAAYAALPEVDGLFIGRAAWQASGFLSIVERALAARKSVA